MLYLTAIG